jgi:hypothetical protein
MPGGVRDGHCLCRLTRQQVLEADVADVRDFGHPEAMTDEQLKQLALLAHHVYESTDLAYHCLSTLSARNVAAPDAPNRCLAVLG